MKRIQVRKLLLNQMSINIDVISEKIDAIEETHFIDTVNWAKYSEKPLVKFKIAYTNGYILLKYYVEENHIRAVNTLNNSTVWEDSCCEFFCAPSAKAYYNLEVNCIGTPLLGYGKDRNNRELQSDEVIDRILVKSSLGRKVIEAATGNYSWELTLVIPVSVFTKDKIENLEGKVFKVNFYKCGDKTPKMHFLSWNPIETPRPDFHRTDYFGELEFVAE